MLVPVDCLLVVLELTSYVPSGTTQAFITGTSPGLGFQSSREVSKSSAILRQKSAKEAQSVQTISNFLFIAKKLVNIILLTEPSTDFWTDFLCILQRTHSFIQG